MTAIGIVSAKVFPDRWIIMLIRTWFAVGLAILLVVQRVEIADFEPTLIEGVGMGVAGHFRMRLIADRLGYCYALCVFL